MQEQQQYDGVLTQMIQSQKGYEGFFDLIFEFLGRKTDFFSDPLNGQKLVKESAEKGWKIFLQIKEDSRKKEEEKNQKKQQQQTQQAQTEKPKESPQELKKEVPQTNTQAQQNPVKEETKKEDGPAEGKIMPNKQNGSQTDTYKWSQTLNEITVEIPLEQKITKKDLFIDLRMDGAWIANRNGSKVYMDGQWTDQIAFDDINWTITNESGQKKMEIYITKWRTSMTWWDSLLKNEQKIDTQKINPEPSKLSDLDGEMKQTVGKMMFDMQQKQQGLPSSDELEKRQKLEGFMKANPQFDFSKAKFG